MEVEQSVDGDVTTRVWHTPAGELREVSKVCRDPTGAVSSNWTEHPIKTPADIPRLAAIFEAAKIPSYQTEADAAKKAAFDKAFAENVGKR